MTMATAGVAGVASGYTGVAKINNAAILPVSPATVSGIIAPATFPAGVSGNGASNATGASFTYSEAGAFTLAGYDPASDSTSPRGVYDGVQTASECVGMTASQCDSLRLTTSWTGIDSVSTSGDCIADSYTNTKANGKYGCNFGLVSTTSGFGRFVPNEFAVVSPILTNRHAAACVPASTFSYLDEAMRLQFTLEARAGGGNVTRNYAGTLAKLVLLEDGSELDFGAAVPAPFQALASNRIVGASFPIAWPAMGDAGAGAVNFDGSVSVSSLNSAASSRVGPDGPFAGLALGVAPVDPDGVRILVYDLDADNSGGVAGPDRKAVGTTTQYFGLLRLVPAIGTELLSLSMRAEILRWNGTAFVPNGDDGCTQIPMANLGLSNWTSKLSTGETGITSGALTFASGVGAIKLSAPGAGNNGSVLVTAGVSAASMPYLGGHWSGASKYDQDPSAVASFGLYRGAGQIIHFRENY
jgi:MSHA biogenesis protein MshQ